MKKILISITLLLLISSCSKSKENWLIVPGKSVGNITAETSEEELKQLFGSANVVRKQIYIGEGMRENGTVVFPGKKNELEIFWTSEYKPPIERIVIDQPKTNWITEAGITSGTKLESLNLINGKPFIFYGFDWDYGGSVVSWEGGHLDKFGKSKGGLFITLSYKKDAPAAEHKKVSGDIEVPSDRTVLNKMGVFVEKIEVQFFSNQETVGKVTAASGLSLRERPSTKGNKLASIPSNSKVLIVKFDGPEEIIDGVKAPWFKVSYGEQSGWVFSGYIEIAE